MSNSMDVDPEHFGLKGGYTLKSVRGAVLDAQKNRETQVDVSGGGVLFRPGIGHFPDVIETKPIRVTSTTIVHDNLTVANRNGGEFGIQLKGFDLNVRASQDISIVFGVKRGSERGHCVLVHNHTTGQGFYNVDALREVTKTNLGDLLMPVIMLLVFPPALIAYFFVPALREYFANTGKGRAMATFRANVQGWLGA